MKYLSMKILMALGIISATSMQGVYATATKEADTNLDKVTQSIQSNDHLDEQDKESLTHQVENFENLSNQEKDELIQILEDNDIFVPDVQATQPTFISNNR